MENLKPNERRAKNAILLIWIVLALEIASLISSYLQYNLLQTIARGGGVSDEVVLANDIREGIVGLLYSIAYIISVITFIMWFSRAYANLHEKTNNLHYSKGWAIGGWFVPILGLYCPYQIMKELYVETKNILQKQGFAGSANYTTNYMDCWWTLFVITLFLGCYSFRYVFLSSDTIEGQSISTIAQMILNIVDIPLALITIKVIKDYSIMEPLLQEIPEDLPLDNFYGRVDKIFDNNQGF
ncbi:hypothetical protein FACS189440_21200 [Bacteroidia bacterium]|nr:hypothetical protein FACS189440_21200 [Bacteroidia bacterium]